MVTWCMSFIFGRSGARYLTPPSGRKRADLESGTLKAHYATYEHSLRVSQKQNRSEEPSVLLRYMLRTQKNVTNHQHNECEQLLGSFLPLCDSKLPEPPTQHTLNLTLDIQGACRPRRKKSKSNPGVLKPKKAKSLCFGVSGLVWGCPKP